MIRTIFRLFPGLVIVLLLFNITAFVEKLYQMMQTHQLVLIRNLPSGQPLVLTPQEALVLLALLILFLEIFKATNTSTLSVIEHLLSMLVLVVFVFQLITVERLATAPFFMVTLISAIDVASGITVGIISARRDVGIS